MADDEPNRDAGGSSASAAAEAEPFAAAQDAPPSAPPRDAIDNEEENRVSLGVRVFGAVVYLAVCAACVYLSIPFFVRDQWWFGMMGIGLALIALQGVRQSLFSK
jgi:hypothetical protein